MHIPVHTLEVGPGPYSYLGTTTVTVGPHTWTTAAAATTGGATSTGFSHLLCFNRALYQYFRPSGALCSVHSLVAADAPEGAAAATAC